MQLYSCCLERSGDLCSAVEPTCDPVLTMSSLLGSVFSMSAACRSSLGSKGALPSRWAASRYEVRLRPKKQSCLPEASAAFLTLDNLHRQCLSPANLYVTFADRLI